MYSVKEVYYTIQGEGYHTGRPAIFLRFTGCNLWSGLEKDRATAICNFCDTDFVGTNGPGGGKFNSAKKLANHALSFWPKDSKSKPFVVCTGGEPLLQIDSNFINSFHELDFEIAVETNGTIIPPDGLDWICVSPKVGSNLILKTGDELKFVYPQKGENPKEFENLSFNYFSLQPMDNANKDDNTQKTIEFCHDNPHWSMSLQTHKFLGIP